MKAMQALFVLLVMWVLAMMLVYTLGDMPAVTPPRAHRHSDMLFFKHALDALNEEDLEEVIAAAQTSLSQMRKGKSIAGSEESSEPSGSDDVDSDSEDAEDQKLSRILENSKKLRKKRENEHTTPRYKKHRKSDDFSEDSSNDDDDNTPTEPPRKHKKKRHDDDDDDTSTPPPHKKHHKPDDSDDSDPPPRHKHQSKDDTSVADNTVKSHPGGTEAEALAARRELSDKNFPLDSFKDAVWKADGERRELPEAFRTNLMESASLRSLYDDAKGHCPASEGSEESSSDGSTFPHANINVNCYQKRYYHALKEAKFVSIDNPGCEDIYSYPGITKFKKRHVEVCSPEDEESSIHKKRIEGSQMECYTRRIRGHSIDTTICQAHHVMLDYSKMPHAKDYPWLDFKKGALKGKCSINTKLDFKGMFMQCIADWFTKGLTVFEEEEEPICDVIVDTPTYFVTRAGDYSPFHIAHDFTNAFISAAVLGFNFDDIQIVIHDRMTKGFYLPLWQWVYSAKKKLLWYPDLAEEYKGKKVCYKRAMFNVPARLSLLYNNHDDCIGTSSSTLRAWSDFVLGAFDLVGVSSKAKRLSVTLIARRNYKTGHAIGRRFGNEDALVDMLEALEVEGFELVVNVIDYADWDFDVQMKISRGTDLLVAMHGAGLIQMSFLPQWGGVFEFFCPEKPSSNFRYKHLSGYYGLNYASFTLTDSHNTVPIASTKEVIRTLLTQVSARKTKFLKQKSTQSEDD